MYLENEKWMVKSLRKYRVSPHTVDHCCISGTFDYKSCTVIVRNNIEIIKTIFKEHGWDYIFCEDNKITFRKKK